MTTSRKFTLALSYLRSAFDDMAISQPSLRPLMSSIICQIINLRCTRQDISGKCYNISY